MEEKGVNFITHNVPSIAVRFGFNSIQFQKQIKDEHRTTLSK
jgi:hypothetical protein